MGHHSSTAAREEINPKVVARRQAQLRQQKLSPDWVVQASRGIQASAVALPLFQSARAIACYLARPREVQTSAILAAAWKAGKRVAVPAWLADRQSYGLSWLAEGQATRPGEFHVLEPVQPDWVKPGELDLMVVPCLAFDAYGRRLGHGGGHFDRLMTRHDVPKVCLAFEGQRMLAVPFEPHDAPVDWIVTETGAHARA